MPITNVLEVKSTLDKYKTPLLALSILLNIFLFFFKPENKQYLFPLGASMVLIILIYFSHKAIMAYLFTSNMLRIGERFIVPAATKFWRLPFSMQDNTDIRPLNDRETLFEFSIVGHGIYTIGWDRAEKTINRKEAHRSIFEIQSEYDSSELIRNQINSQQAQLLIQRRLAEKGLESTSLGSPGREG